MEPKQPKTGERLVPEVWTQQVLTWLTPKDDWWAKYVGKYPAIEPPPWYKRRWRRLKWRVNQAREALAVKIAPWLERDEWD